MGGDELNYLHLGVMCGVLYIRFMIIIIYHCYTQSYVSANLF